MGDMDQLRLGPGLGTASCVARMGMAHGRDIRPTVASVEQGLRFPRADMGPWNLHGMGSYRGQAGTTSPRGSLRAWTALLKDP